MSFFIVRSAAHYVLNYHQWHMRLSRSFSDSSNSWIHIQDAQEDAKKLARKHVSWYRVVYLR